MYQREASIETTTGGKVMSAQREATEEVSARRREGRVKEMVHKGNTTETNEIPANRKTMGTKEMPRQRKPRRSQHKEKTTGPMICQHNWQTTGTKE